MRKGGRALEGLPRRLRDYGVSQIDTYFTNHLQIHTYFTNDPQIVRAFTGASLSLEVLLLSLALSSPVVAGSDSRD